MLSLNELYSRLLDGKIHEIIVIDWTALERHAVAVDIAKLLEEREELKLMGVKELGASNMNNDFSPGLSGLLHAADLDHDRPPRVGEWLQEVDDGTRHGPSPVLRGWLKRAYEVAHNFWEHDLKEWQILATKKAYDLGAAVYRKIEWSPLWESTALEPLNKYLDYVEDLIRKRPDLTEVNSAIVDLGLGTGRLLKEAFDRFYEGKSEKDAEGKVTAVEKGIEILGLDYSAPMIEQAKEELGEYGLAPSLEADSPICVAEEDIMTEKFVHLAKSLLNNRKVVGISCNSATTHVPKEYMKTFFELCSQLLVEGGVLYIGEKITNDGRIFTDKKIGEKNKRWFTTYTKEEIGKLVDIARYAGFELITDEEYRDHHDKDKPPWVELFFRYRGN